MVRILPAARIGALRAAEHVLGQRNLRCGCRGKSGCHWCYELNGICFQRIRTAPDLSSNRRTEVPERIHLFHVRIRSTSSDYCCGRLHVQERSEEGRKGSRWRRGTSGRCSANWRDTNYRSLGIPRSISGESLTPHQQELTASHCSQRICGSAERLCCQPSLPDASRTNDKSQACISMVVGLGGQCKAQRSRSAKLGRATSATDPNFPPGVPLPTTHCAT